MNFNRGANYELAPRVCPLHQSCHLYDLINHIRKKNNKNIRYIVNTKIPKNQSGWTQKDAKGHEDPMEKGRSRHRTTTDSGSTSNSDSSDPIIFEILAIFCAKNSVATRCKTDSNRRTQRSRRSNGKRKRPASK